MNAYWITALVAVGTALGAALGSIAKVEGAAKALGTLFGWVADVCWLVSQLRNARKLRALARAEKRGVPICPKCHVPMEFQGQGPIGSLATGMFIRDYKCSRCGFDQPVRFRARQIQLD